MLVNLNNDYRDSQTQTVLLDTQKVSIQQYLTIFEYLRTPLATDSAARALLAFKQFLIDPLQENITGWGSRFIKKMSNASVFSSVKRILIVKSTQLKINLKLHFLYSIIFALLKNDFKKKHFAVSYLKWFEKRNSIPSR